MLAKNFNHTARTRQGQPDRQAAWDSKDVSLLPSWHRRRVRIAASEIGWWVYRVQISELDSEWGRM